MLKTEQREAFSLALKDAISSSGVRAFKTHPKDQQWHPNEDRTRWFLVLRVEDEDDELMKLLHVCNNVATQYDQPRLYEDGGRNGPASRKFHISIAWSLQKPSNIASFGNGEAANGGTKLLEPIRKIAVPFSEVKVRIGQDVTSMPLNQKRRRTSGVLS